MGFLANVWQSAPKGTYGKHYRGTFGFQVRKREREMYFDRAITRVALILDGEPVSVEITPSFWRDCPKLRHPRIRDYCQKHRLMPGKHRPEERRKVEMRVIEPATKFAVSLLG
ncbi:MAG: hypothetical protein B1H03_01805 [Planctomycetales bacterium 4484_113]|nr:MAG: hypothetical protein B1H03_01805 [Planctomycetales bacterium 4484_113]